MSKPPVIKTTKPLPFDALEPLEFERLCLWLVDREGYLRPEHLGEAGGEHGRDITAYKITSAGEELWYFQCKRRKKVGAADLKREVDKYKELASQDATKKPAGIIFVTNAVLSDGVRQAVAAYCQSCDYFIEFWAHTELDLKVKKHPEIVKEFFSVPEPAAYTSLHQLPSPPNDFTGRSDEVAEAAAALSQGGKSIIGLYGMGGAGKTALALKLAEQIIPLYPDAQIYLDLRGTSREPLSVADVMLHIIRAYQPAEGTSKNEAETAGKYRTVLYGKRGILLLDDAADREQVEPLIPPAGWVLIVTSRQRFHLPGMFPVRLGPLPREESLSLLKAITPRATGQAGPISQLCGDIPLALRLAGSALAEREDIEPEDYVRRLSDSSRRLSLVDASIALSYELLNDLGRELWRRLAVFPADFQAEGAAQVMGLGLEAELARDVLGEFVGYSLLEWDTAKGRYRLHDLMRLFAGERLSDAERHDCQLRFVNYYGAILTEANSLYPLGGAASKRALTTLDAEWDNFRTAQAWAAENMESDDEAAEICNAFPNAGAYLLDLRQNPRERISWLEAALRAARKLNSRDSEGAHLTNLGLAYTSAGEPRRAVEMLKHALVIHRELGDRMGEGQVLGSLGSAYATLGDYRHAAEFYEQDLAIMRELGERQAEGAVLNNLANAYVALGDTGRAIALYDESLAKLRETGDRYREGRVLGSLGLLHAEQGNNPLAVHLHRQSLQACREFGDLREEGHTLGNLGVALFNLRDYKGALECHLRQLAIAREEFDPHGEASALGGLASVYTFTGEYGRAAQCFEQTVKLFRVIGDRYMEGKTLGNWGNLLLKCDDVGRALELYEQQLAIVREIGDRRGEANALWNTGWASHLRGDIARAVGYGEAALRIYEEIGDTNNAARARKYLAEWHGLLR